MTDMREQLRQQALTYPEAWEDTPWEDDLVVKVRKKIFVFLGTEGSAHAGVKLTESLEAALRFEGVEPSGYGLGRHGWVQVSLTAGIQPGLLMDWLDESYRVVAPKTLAAQLDRSPTLDDGPARERA